MKIKNTSEGIEATFEVYSAYTLPPEEVGSEEETGKSTRTHEDGWTIEGEVVEDWFYWVNEFEATHPDLGFVRGDFEETIYASSEETLKHFMENHPPEEWDYDEI
jgi:hypothetical protein